jgi:ribosomal protein S18 acetylase RimI-like enzyme
MIEATVDEMLKNTKPTMGLLGEVIQHAPLIMYRPKPGTVLAKLKRSSTDSAITVRVASPKDDVDIAQLRLSVFSDFTPETRKIFCDRSCHLLSTRRQRGAMCIVAATGSEKPSPFMTPITEKNRIIGTAEISFHEFSETKLGRSRPKDSILYVTEVAVNSKHRRKGIANLMMEAVDKVAKIRKTETIYLHVDVENVAALRLYQRAGYAKLPSDDPVFLEFTTKLNLHDGATKGRRHFLMAKDVKEPTWLENKYKDESLNIQTQRGTLGIEVLQ